MKTSDLAGGLGISPQMTNRLIRQGMPRDLDLAIKWRKSNLKPFRTKSLRIGGNSGKTYSPVKVNLSHEIERNSIEKTLTETVPNLYFERVDWLAVAIKDAGVPVTGAQIIEIQDNLFTTYLEEIIYGHFQINSFFELPPLSLMRLDSLERKAVIDSLDMILTEETIAD